MLIISKRNSAPWLWVNIPKTSSSVLYNTFAPHMPIVSQRHSSYGELVSIFKYESTSECFGVADAVLGYNIRDEWIRKYPNNLGIDFSDETVVYLLRMLYREDYETLNY